MNINCIIIDLDGIQQIKTGKDDSKTVWTSTEKYVAKHACKLCGNARQSVNKKRYDQAKLRHAFLMSDFIRLLKITSL